MNVEVCIDNFESLNSAQRGGANRIELCGALALGGITPNYGLIKAACQHASIPVYVMIRPRSGDFFYSEDEVAIMLSDIYAARRAGAQGVVLGVLDKQANIDRQVLKSLVAEAGQMGVTFHRAIDLVANVEDALETIIAAGCERVLTSGQEQTALAGVNTLKQMVVQANNRISIMAGAGVSGTNVKQIVDISGVHEVHLSGKSQRQSYMTVSGQQPSMGSADDMNLNVTSETQIRAVVKALT
ncbi:copper homeostasis protein CutC [Motilimonas pumila]|uniref:PF03932 family protein CutC n=1 Tax=Motilimonas pumila TaxID=2303987 RepID=A0A418YK67_9GAMM|nr:copper homeostasis protein CutC [Motilimonas pumila]RJG51365.1 copper homeostasis protein CutC [Motilimonas pumila]